MLINILYYVICIILVTYSLITDNTGYFLQLLFDIKINIIIIYNKIYNYIFL